MKDILVIIPCYNEEANITNVYNELIINLPQADILVVDDCSRDNTLAIIKGLGINYISLPFNLGYSGALQAGFKYALQNNYETVIQFDGDGQHIPSEAQKLLEKFDLENSDVIIGSRFLLNNEYKHGFLKTLATKLFTLLIRIISGSVITDPTSGFQIINKKIFSYYSEMNNYPDYPDANLIIEMLLKGYKIIEMPVKMRPRSFGVSMHSGFWKPIVYMIKMFYSIFMIFLNFSFSHLKRLQYE